MTPVAALVPPWLVRAAAVGWRVLATIGMGVVLLFIASQIPVTLTAILVSLVFAAALAPTALRLRARGLSRIVAAAITFVAGAALVVLAAVVVIVVLLGDVRSVAIAVQDGMDDVRDGVSGIGPDQLSAMLGSINGSVASALAPDVAAIATTIGNVVTVIVLGTFLTFFLLMDGDRGWAWFLNSLRPWQAEAVQSSARHGLDQVAWYVRRTALLATLDGLVVWSVLAIFGVPLAGALGVIAFLAGFVPYIGAVTAGLIALLAALALAGPIPAIAVAAALIATSIVATRLLETTPMNSSIDVHPMLVVVALPAGVALFGVLGLLALLPITVFARAVSRSVIAALDIAPAARAADDAATLVAAPLAAAPPEPVATPPIVPVAGEGMPSLGERPDEGIPPWLDRVAQWSWRGLVLLVLIGLVIRLVTLIPVLLVPTVIAVVGGATLRPLVDRLTAGGWRRGLAASVSTVGTLGAVVGACVLAIGMTLGPFQEAVGSAAAGAGSLSVPWLGDVISQAGGQVSGDVATIAADAISLGIALLLALLMTFFVLRDGPQWWSALLTRLDRGRREPVALAGGRSADLVASYMLGTAAISLFGAVTCGLILVLLGIPLAFPIAVISFFAGFIPYIGSFISTGLATLVTVAFGTTTDLVVMLIFTVVFNIVQGNILTPLVYGKSLSLHPAIVLMSIPVGNEIAGIMGMFLVVPIAAVIAATWRLVPMTIDGTGLPPDLEAELLELVPEAAADAGPVTLIEPAPGPQS